MGYFSFMFADTDNKKSLRIGRTAYVPIPKDKGGGQLVETDYDGYGRFDGHDIYDLVADWNKGLLTREHMRKPERSMWAPDAQGEEWFQWALSRWKRDCEILDDFQSGMSDEEMTKKWDRDWKRNLGINVACYDDQNAALPYPIKICAYKDSVYEEVGPSEGDPDQGFF